MCLNTASGLKPLYDSDLEEKKKLKIGQEYECEIRVVRNYQFLKKFMALCWLGFHNQDWCEQFEHYRKWLTMKAGFVDIIATPTGTMYEAKSISFSAMDEVEFERVYQAVIDVLMKEIGIEKRDIERELLNFM